MSENYPKTPTQIIVSDAELESPTLPRPKIKPAKQLDHPTLIPNEPPTIEQPTTIYRKGSSGAKNLKPAKHPIQIDAAKPQTSYPIVRTKTHDQRPVLSKTSDKTFISQQKSKTANNSHKITSTLANSRSLNFNTTTSFEINPANFQDLDSDLNNFNDSKNFSNNPASKDTQALRFNKNSVFNRKDDNDPLPVPSKDLLGSAHKNSDPTLVSETVVNVQESVKMSDAPGDGQSFPKLPDSVAPPMAPPAPDQAAPAQPPTANQPQVQAHYATMHHSRNHSSNMIREKLKQKLTEKQKEESQKQQNNSTENVETQPLPEAKDRRRTHSKSKTRSVEKQITEAVKNDINVANKTFSNNFTEDDFLAEETNSNSNNKNSASHPTHLQTNVGKLTPTLDAFNAEYMEMQSSLGLPPKYNNANLTIDEIMKFVGEGDFDQEGENDGGKNSKKKKKKKKSKNKNLSAVANQENDSRSSSVNRNANSPVPGRETNNSSSSATKTANTKTTKSSSANNLQDQTASATSQTSSNLTTPAMTPEINRKILEDNKKVSQELKKLKKLEKTEKSSKKNQVVVQEETSKDLQDDSKSQKVKSQAVQNDQEDMSASPSLTKEKNTKDDVSDKSNSISKKELTHDSQPGKQTRGVKESTTQSGDTKKTTKTQVVGMNQSQVKDKKLDQRMEKKEKTTKPVEKEAGKEKKLKVAGKNDKSQNKTRLEKLKLNINKIFDPKSDSEISDDEVDSFKKLCQQTSKIYKSSSNKVVIPWNF